MVYLVYRKNSRDVLYILSKFEPFQSLSITR